MIYHLDTSALVKAYVDEDRSQEVRALLRQAEPGTSSDRLFVSRLAYPETMSAFTRLRNEGKLSAPEAEMRFRALDSDFTGPTPAYEILDPTAVVVNEGAALVRRNGLRGFDAVHLASAVLLSQAAGGACLVVAADRQLLKAAEAEGLGVLDLLR
ncbi:MAG TPA: type II toxin-antitoxin system VapC family toxin [Longimicrobiaceae bacterium]|nr:type II toxin-antitoxin system VapC family toxin [Longimicrobiaceae bacterium]